MNPIEQQNSEHDQNNFEQQNFDEINEYSVIQELKSIIIKKKQNLNSSSMISSSNLQSSSMSVSSSAAINQLNEAEYHQQKQQFFQLKKQQFLNYLNNLKYDDDDEIFPYSDQEGVQKFDLENNLTFKVQALRNSIILKKQDQQIPALLSLQFKDEKYEPNQFDLIKQRIGIDLICVLDRSSSMKGQKIEMLKQTLSILIKFLSDKDRLQLIAFDNFGEKLTPLKVVNDENKEYFQQKIDSITASSGTFIRAGTHIAFEQIKQRKYKNNVTSILILSDGQDCYAKDSVSKQLEYLKEEILTIHTFGYGRDHDAAIMIDISKLGNGAFYYIQDINLLGVFFGNLFGGLKSIVASDIKFDLQCKPQEPFDAISISKTYGTFWQENEKSKQYQLYVPQLSFGQSRNFVFELLIPNLTNVIQQDEGYKILILEANLMITNPQNQQIIKKSAYFELNFYDQQDQIIEEMFQKQINIDVQVQYFKIQAALTMLKAQQICEKDYFKEARRMMWDQIVQISENEEVKALSADIIKDLKQAIQAADEQDYYKYGNLHMSQMISNSNNQQGVNSQFLKNGKQLVITEGKQQYSNQFQVDMQNQFLTLSEKK